MEGFPNRKRSIENIDKLVYSPEMKSEWVTASRLEPGMWSVEHGSAIANKFDAAGQGYRIVLENGLEFPIDLDDGLAIQKP